jgi:trehalose-6-phosphate synthase
MVVFLLPLIVERSKGKFSVKQSPVSEEGDVKW